GANTFFPRNAENATAVRNQKTYNQKQFKTVRLSYQLILSVCRGIRCILGPP
ncbi:unnamed protein product, partial [Urochloa humidicola]